MSDEYRLSKNGRLTDTDLGSDYNAAITKAERICADKGQTGENDSYQVIRIVDGNPVASVHPSGNLDGYLTHHKSTSHASLDDPAWDHSYRVMSTSQPRRPEDEPGYVRHTIPATTEQIGKLSCGGAVAIVFVVLAVLSLLVVIARAKP